jgi:hypothetical protein
MGKFYVFYGTRRFINLVHNNTPSDFILRELSPFTPLNLFREAEFLTYVAIYARKSKFLSRVLYFIFYLFFSIFRNKR